MDFRFLALLLVGSSTAFAGTWMYLDQPGAAETAQLAAAPVNPAAAPVNPAATAVRNPGGQMVQIKDCNHARAMGVAPLMAGQPGYRADLDFDGDGLACSPA